MEAQMTVKTTLSFIDRHHHFLMEKVGQGVFATQSAAVAAALEQMMLDAYVGVIDELLRSDKALITKTSYAGIWVMA
jgi:Arc/MetJ-type ribon-helix-helix transcriptional regulator